ncbi:hypothetical protein GF345_06860 [Candidatus Woesearchaeota archaeon]|nr:hypothetical protein [Candidatus Woesearchaeota archaeon]
MEEILERIGLTPTESKVYLALLDLGEAKTGEILKKAGLNSGRIYGVLDSLQEKGLVSSVVKKKVKLFIPSPPERVLDYLNEQVEDIEEQKEDFSRVLPKLEEKFRQLKQKTSVEVFIGTEGFRTANSIFFRQAGKDKNLCIYGIVRKHKYSKALLDTLQYYVYKKRRDLKLNTRKLISEEAREEKFYFQDNSKIRYIPFPSITSVEMLGDMTMIQALRDPVIVILIKHKEITDDYRKQFEFLWRMAKK